MLAAAAVVGVLAVGMSLSALAARERQQDYIWGTVRLDNGFYIYTKVYPVSVVSDQFFSFWAGEAEGRGVLLDPFSQIWYLAPVQYQRTAIVFRGEELEGFVRVWGNVMPYIDGNYFFGVDGMAYKLQKKYRRSGPAGKKKKRLIYSYYENLVTGERSDWLPRTEEEQKYYESFLRTGEGGAAFPLWGGGASEEEPPVSTAPLEEPPGEAVPAEAEAETETQGEAEADGGGAADTGEPPPDDESTE